MDTNQFMDTGKLYKERAKLAKLLRHYFDGALTVEERDSLALWLRESPANRKSFQAMKSGRALSRRCEMREKIDTRREFELFSNRYPEITRLRWRRRIFQYASIASSIVLLVGFFWMFSKESAESVKLAGTQATVDDKLQAILKTADGEVITIRQGEDWQGVSDSTGFILEKDNGQLVIEKKRQTANESIKYHQLDVPRGSEYRLKLPDGSVVWLNSESTIRFPEQFSATKREVVVTGELFFDVTKDPKRPFIVKSGEFQTEVLGTRFGIRTYSDDANQKIILEEGKVRVRYHESELVLKPGEMAYTEEKRLTAAKANLSKELGWVYGKIIFEHDELQHIVHYLAKWYDVDFKFENEELKTFKFTVSGRRDAGFDDFLHLIEQTNVITFEKKEGYILIKQI